MRLLFVTPYLPSLIRVRPYNFIRDLSERHDITLLATDSPTAAKDLELLQPYCRSIHLVPLRRPSAITGCVRSAMRGEPLQAGFCRSPEFEGELRRVLDEVDFDAVHVEHIRAAHLEEFIPTGTPMLYDSVDSISLLMERTLGCSHSLRQRAIARLELHRTRSYEARLLRRFNQVAVTSAEDRRALLALEPSASNVTVVPNGVDLHYFQPSEGRRDDATLVFSGKMSYHANVTALVHFVRNIFPLVRRSRPEARLLVVGSNPPPAVRALGRDPGIATTGHVPDIRPYLDTATIAICPVTVKVGIQNKVLEAMAMGLPVVSTREGAQGIAAESGRDLLVADSAEEFADHVCRLLSDPGLRGAIGRSGRRYVENHHQWKVAASKLEALYVEDTTARREGSNGAAHTTHQGRAA